MPTSDKPEGAFVEAVRAVIKEDFSLKSKILKDMIDNPGKYPELNGEEMMEFIFGDLQRFADGFKGLD